MHKYIVFLILACFMVTIPSCTRKGDDDPAISLRTRKNRLVGKWKLETATGTYSELRGAYKNEWQYKNGIETCFSINPNLPDHTLYFTSELEFTKDEKFTWEMRTSPNEVATMKGSWHFIHDGDRGENKSQLILYPESTAGRWPYGLVIQFPIRQQTPLFDIDELRHEKVVLSRSYEVPHIGSSTGLPITGTETFRFIPQ